MSFISDKIRLNNPMPDYTLSTPISILSGVGPAMVRRLRRLNIETFGDLLGHYPQRYEDFGAITPIVKVQPGELATIVGTVEMIASRRSRSRRVLMTEAMVSDESGSIKIIWFNQPWIAQQIRPNEVYHFAGKVLGDVFSLHLNSPLFERQSSEQGRRANILPIYPLTDGLTQKSVAALVKRVLELLPVVEDILPAGIIKSLDLLPYREALAIVHQPTNNEELEKARRRLAFDELFIRQLRSARARQLLAKQSAYPITFDQPRIKEFVDRLPFTLTNGQKKSAWEIIQDLEHDRPMNRLLEGDVGSGKTLVALIAVYAASGQGFQSALMAPTEILAGQHYQTALKYLADQNVRVGLLTSGRAELNGESIKKKDLLECLATGEIDLIIGTHALIQKGVSIAKLALVIIDEQHRFGVRQRELLQKQSEVVPHLLSLTATPIPRSLALTIYGDLDLSLIKEMPDGRQKIITEIVTPDGRGVAEKMIDQEITSGRQVFIICPLIDPSDRLGFKSVKEEYERLQKIIFPTRRIGILHGRLKSDEKENVLQQFNRGELDIIISTTVVEVGIDVPNASVMVIEGAERFGLAQLHQLRGRVGRGEHQSHCYLMTDVSDPQLVGRLQVMVTCDDGFALAQADLELRGSGAIHGYEQSGALDFKIANLQDIELIKQTREQAEQFLANNKLADFSSLEKAVEVVGKTDHLE